MDSVKYVLSNITYDERNILGEGAFGKVYKGTVD